MKLVLYDFTKMLKTFEQYCNVYEICENDNILQQYKDIANIIISQKENYKNIITFHRHWYLFYYFDKFIKDEISLEDFFLLWDITSNHNILQYQSKNSSNIRSMEIIYNNLQNKDSKFQNSLIIIDDWARKRFNFNYQGEEEVVKKLAENQSSQIIFL